MGTDLSGSKIDKTVNPLAPPADSRPLERFRTGFTKAFFRRRFTAIELLGVFAVIGLVGFVGLQFYNFAFRAKTLEISGRIEAPESHLSAAMPGRVVMIAVKEGDVVHKGQLLISLDSRLLKSKMNEASSFISQARGAQSQARSQVAAAQGDINTARRKSKGFFAKLFSTPKGRAKKAAQLRQQMTGAQVQLYRAQSGVIKAQAAREEAAAKMSYFDIVSPIDGVCETRSIEPGELATAGRVLMVLGDPSRAFLKGYIAEGDIGKVKIGQKANVFLDSNQNEPLSGQINSIESVASFTPENVYFKKDRVRQVYGMTISIDHPGGLAKPGMPADATIILSTPGKGN